MFVARAKYSVLKCNPKLSNLRIETIFFERILPKVIQMDKIYKDNGVARLGIAPFGRGPGLSPTRPTLY